MPDGKDRPSEFAAPVKGNDELFVFRRLMPADGAKEKPARVGHIILEGNTKTEQRVILKMLPLGPGDVLDYDILRTAEKNLAAFRATITVEESIWNADYKDVRVRVMEK
jgi:outer membrane protein assembly factor BamA